MIEDLFSRTLAANEVQAVESSKLAAALLDRACLSERIGGRPLVLRSNNRSAMRDSSMLARMQHLGVAPSLGRLRVSNDNTYAESLYLTAKYCPMWPERPFETFEQARAWVADCAQWYNRTHRHSSLKCVTPAQCRKRCLAIAKTCPVRTGAMP